MPVDIFLLLSLVKKSDVVIDNFRAGTMDRLGVGYLASFRGLLNPPAMYGALFIYPYDSFKSKDGRA